MGALSVAEDRNKAGEEEKEN